MLRQKQSNKKLYQDKNSPSSCGAIFSTFIQMIFCSDANATRNGANASPIKSTIVGNSHQSSVRVNSQLSAHTSAITIKYFQCV